MEMMMDTNNGLPVVVSFGGGVQSTALALMVLNGDMPRPDAFVYADTGDEPVAVNEHVERWKARLEAAGYEFAVLRHKSGLSLYDWTVQRAKAGKSGINQPMFILTEEGDPTPVGRSCTRDFKTTPIRQWLRSRYGVNPHKDKAPRVIQWLGISADEMGRMSDAREKWLQNRWPLVERGIRRTHCLSYLHERGEDAPRSACVYCPFHSRAEWARVASVQTDWSKAQTFEREIHAAYDSGKLSTMRSKPYLLRSRVPLTLEAIDSPQMEMFGGMDNACEGLCGV